MNKMYDQKIVELKYELENDSQANFISNQFPFRIDKSSKYRGIVTEQHKFQEQMVLILLQ